MKMIKVAISMLLIFCTFFCSGVSVFATEPTTPTADGGLTEYDGSLITYDYVLKNQNLFQNYKAVKNFDLADLNASMQKFIGRWIQEGRDKNGLIPLYKFIFDDMYSWKYDGIPHTSYIYFLGECYGDSIFKKTIAFSETPAVIMDGYLLIESKGLLSFQNTTANASGWSAGGSFDSATKNGKEYYKFGKQDLSAIDLNRDYLSVVYPIGGEIMPIMDGGGNTIPGTGGSGSSTDGDHGGGGTGFDSALEFTVTPDLSSKSFNQGEITDIQVSVTNKGKRDAFFAVNFSKFSASNTSPRTVMDEAPIFNYREWSHMYDVNGTEGRYQYRQAISISAGSTKTVTIPISYLNLEKFTGEWIYMNLMDHLGDMGTGLVSTQFKANKEYYFKLNFTPEYKPPQYGDGTPNGGNDDVYDKDGNVVDPSKDPKDDPFLDFINNATKKIISVMKDIVASFKELGVYASGFFGFLGDVFSFLPASIWLVLTLGLIVALLLRIIGR